MSSAARILGANNYTQVGESRVWSRDQGWTTVKEYEGPKDKIRTLINSLVDDPAIDGLSENKRRGKGSLDVTYVDDDGSGGGGTTEQQNETWQLIGQDLCKNIRAHTTFNKDANQNDLENTRVFYESGGGRGIRVGSEPSVTYFALLRRGVSEYVRTAIILRKTITAGPRSLLRASWTGVDRAWKLDGEPGSPNLATAGEAAIIGALSEMDDFDNEKKQWLKRGPTVSPTGRRRYNISAEWWFARRWSETLYSGENEDGNP